MKPSCREEHPRIVDLSISDNNDIEAGRPFSLFFLEKPAAQNSSGGGHQTYVATGTVQDVQWDPD